MNVRRYTSSLRRLLAVLIISLGSVAAHGQAPAPAAATLDQQDFQKALDAFDQGKYDEARGLFAGIQQNYPTSPLIPQAVLRLGYTYFRLNDYDRAAENLEKVATLKGATPDVVELALSLAPQVLAAKASGMKPDAPARKTTFENAVKGYDLFLQKFPQSDEVEATNYGKAVALYQLGKYEDAGNALKINLTKFAASESVLDSEYLYALVLGTLANVSLEKATANDPTIEVNFSNAEKLLNDVINKRTDFALANDAHMQTGEMLLGRASFIKEEDKKKAMLNRALDAFRLVAPRELVVQAQKARIEQIKTRRQAAVAQTHDVAAYKKLGRVIDKEGEKLASIETRPDQTIAAKIKMGQIYLQLDRLDEARVLFNFAKQFAEADDQKKQIAYEIALTLASENLKANAAIPALVQKTEAAYNDFRTAYKADPIGENLALIVGLGFLQNIPELPKEKVEARTNKAIEYFHQSIEDYPKGKFRMNVMAQQAAALINLEKYDEALKTYQEALAQHPDKAVSASAEYGIGVIYQKTGKIPEALTAFKGVREKYAGTQEAEEASFWFAELTREKGDAKAAVKELQAFNEKFPKSNLLPMSLFYLAQAQLAAGQRAEGVATFEDLDKRFPKSEVAPGAYFLRAKVKQEDGKTDEGVAIMRDFIKEYGDNPQVYQAYDYIAQVASSQKHDDEAITTYQEFVAAKPKDPNSAAALLRIATLEKGMADKLGRYVILSDDQKKEWVKHVEAGMAASERVVSDFPNSPQVALALQSLLESQKARQQARLVTDAEIEKYFESFAEKFKDKAATRSKIVFTLAAHLASREKEKAISLMAGAYDPKLRYAPADLDLYGTALIDQKKFDEANQVFQKLAKDYPVPPNTDPTKASREVQEAQAIMLFGTGKVFQEQKNISESKKRFDELEKLYGWSPKMLEANYGIALSLFQQKDYDNALKRLGGVIRSTTAPPELRAKAMLLLAEIHEQMGNYDAAIENYVKIANFYAGVPTIAAEGLWRGAMLLEKEASGQIPMPTPAPKVAVKPAASPAKQAAKAGASPAAKPGPQTVQN